MYGRLDYLIDYCSNPNHAPFGQWIGSLFVLVDSQSESCSMAEKRDLFLCLLKRLIDKGVIVVFPQQDFYLNGVPTVPCRKTFRNYYDSSMSFDSIWDTTGAEVAQYIKEKWPEGVTDPDDEQLNLFWYGNHCPRIGWYDVKSSSVIAS